MLLREKPWLAGKSWTGSVLGHGVVVETVVLVRVVVVLVEVGVDERVVVLVVVVVVVAPQGSTMLQERSPA